MSEIIAIIALLSLFTLFNWAILKAGSDEDDAMERIWKEHIKKQKEKKN